MAKKATKKTTRRKAKKRVVVDEKIEDVPFHRATRRRYLNYALSVITARALPDVRDGLKPVQRRILYTMQHDLHLAPTNKPVKCAHIVGDVLGNYHPHGDTAVYDALVRMAQDFSLRYPMVDGHGNFGSLDGDSAAAYRYTEARLEPISLEVLGELGQDTVDFRPTYDGKTKEPIVLPSRVPQLLVNGATGIAVGMATNIPPHNLTEICTACEALIDERELSTKDLTRFVRGPDFPTGGEILNSRQEIRAIYEEGSGTIRVRGEFKLESTGRGRKAQRHIVISSIPYMVQKNALVRAIGDLVFERKVPQLLDVRDESTTDVRIVLEIKPEADPDVVMAYLYKNTPLQSNFSVNLTCLVPTPDTDVCSPARVDLKSILEHFIEFRYEVVERRFQHELRLLRERIHILDGFRKIFDALDEAIRLIRRSDGRSDAAKKLMKRFDLDDVQVGAILDLRLYKLARLEIQAILDELKEKKRRVKEIEAILASPKRLWRIVKTEIAESREKYGDKRRTVVGARGLREVEVDEEAFIVDEDAYVLLSRDGWVKRAGRIGSLDKVRLRPEDELLDVLAGSTRDCVAFFTNFGSAYTIRLSEIPASRGYGEPVQRFFKFRDGERVLAAILFDKKLLKRIGSAESSDESVELGLGVSSSGYTFRSPLYFFAEPSTRAGRRFARLKEGEEVIGFHRVVAGDTVVLASRTGRVILFAADDVNVLSGPGRGVIGIKLDAKDRVIGSAISRQKSKGLRAYTTGGRKVDVTPRSYRISSRGGKGVEVIKRGGLARVERPPIELPELNGNGKRSGGKRDS